MPEIGDLAPDFTLPETGEQRVSPSDFRGRRNVLLVFHPFSFTSICESEMCELRDHADVLAEHETEVVSISCDAWLVRQVWKRAIEGRGRYLSDFWPHGEVSRRYGVFDEGRGAPRRATFLIDTDGVVRFQVTAGYDERRDGAAYLAAVAGLG
jgi:peroxiredoxin